MGIKAPIPKNLASKPKFVKNQTFFARQFYTLYEQKYSNLRPLPSISFPQGFGKSKKFVKKKLFCRIDFILFVSKNIQILEHFFPLLFLKNSESLKNLGHPTSGNRGKKTFGRYLKSEQTHGHTDGHSQMHEKKKHCKI